MDDKGFLGALFDFSFSSFVTTRIVKLLFLLAVLTAAFGALGIVVQGFGQGFFAGLLSLLILAPLAFLLVTLWARVSLELVLVIFRIAEHAGVTADATRKLAAGRAEVA